MADKTWKATERKIAKLLGGNRVPITGRTRGETPDIEHELLSLEVKHRKKLPDWLHDAMEQAVASKRGEQLPVVVLHENGKRHEDDFVCIKLSDFINIIS